MKKFLVLAAMAVAMAFTAACSSDEGAVVYPMVSQMTVTQALASLDDPSADYYIVDMTLTGMVCMSCEGSVQGIIEGLGARVITVSASSDRLQITYRPGDITFQQIVAALEAEGYSVS